MTPMEQRCANGRKDMAGMPYASVVPDRYPALKYHVGIGRAKLAIGWERRLRYNPETRKFDYQGVRGGEIYRLVGKSWELLYRVEAGTHVNDLPWK